jgi:hypothetical protein
MPYTSEQAEAALKNATNLNDIKAIVNQLDVNASGNTTVLYSGKVGNLPAYVYILEGYKHG